MYKTYEVTDVFSHEGSDVEVGSRLTLHDNAAKYLSHVLREVVEPTPQEKEEVQEAEAVELDPRAEALLPLIDRRAKR